MASVADLVEITLREQASEYLVRAGEALRADGRVELRVFEALRVTGLVHDERDRATELRSESGRLVIRCDCPSGVEGTLCPHAVATAIEAWERAPNRAS